MTEDSSPSPTFVRAGEGAERPPKEKSATALKCPKATGPGDTHTPFQCSHPWSL